MAVKTIGTRARLKSCGTEFIGGGPSTRPRRERNGKCIAALAVTKGWNLCHKARRPRGHSRHSGTRPQGQPLGWFLKEVLYPRLLAGIWLLDAGASRFWIERPLTVDIADGHGCASNNARGLRYHARLETPHEIVEMDLAKI